MHRLRTAISFAAAVSAACLAVVAIPAGAVSLTPHRAAPHTTKVAHTYHVNTTADATLSGSAPAHTCEDTGDTSKCSLRAAILAANADLGASIGTYDVIDVPAGIYDLEAGTSEDSLYLIYQGSVAIIGAGPTKTVIDDNGEGDSENPVFSLDGRVSVSLNGVSIENAADVSDGAAVALADEASLTATDCAFTRDSATSDGGAIYGEPNTAITATDSTFTSDTAEAIGGAIDDSGTSVLTLTGDVFNDDSVTGTSTDDVGGAVFAASNLDVAKTTFEHSSAYGNGGAVYADSDSTFLQDTFSSNQSIDNDAGALFVDEDATITNSTFDDNSAPDADGGALADDEVAQLSGDTFSKNSANNGGDIFDDFDVDIVQSNLDNATASGYGGSIYVGSQSGLQMRGVTISGSRVTSTSAEGGAIYLTDSTYDDLTDVTIEHASAGASGSNGGAITCYECDLSIRQSQLTDDRAGDIGGAIYVDDQGNVTMSGSTLDNNTAANYGGAVGDYDSSFVEISQSTLDNNDASADEGGAIFADDLAELYVVDSTLAHNAANGGGGYGGAIDVGSYMDDDGSTGSIVDSTVADNSATYGGGLYSFGSYVDVESSTFAYNELAHGSAADDAGGFFTNESTLTSTDSIYADNQGWQCGGQSVSYSGGYNLDSDSTCDLYAFGDLKDVTANLLPLGSYGGFTQTVLPAGSSPAVGGGGSSCPGTDQRGYALPAGAVCAIGADFVEGATVTLHASHPSIVKGHEQAEKFTVVVKAKGNANRPSGIVDVVFGTKTVCVAQVRGTTTATGSCSPAPSALPTGTHSVSATYLGSGLLSGAFSTTVKVKVT